MTFVNLIQRKNVKSQKKKNKKITKFKNLFMVSIQSGFPSSYQFKINLRIYYFILYCKTTLNLYII